MWSWYILASNFVLGYRCSRWNLSFIEHVLCFRPKCFTHIIPFNVHKNPSGLIDRLGRHGSLSMLRKLSKLSDVASILNWIWSSSLWVWGLCFNGTIKPPPNVFDVLWWPHGCHCEKLDSSRLFSLEIHTHGCCLPTLILVLSLDTFYYTN